MSRSLLGLAVAVLGISLLASTNRAQAQVGNLGADPFSLYFGYYLPHQAAIAAQPTPMDTINAAQASRQAAAAADRTGLYEPTSPYFEEDEDPMRPYTRRGRERMARPHTFATSTLNHRARGSAPMGHFNRTGTGGSQYYQTLRPGQNPNRQVAATRAPNRVVGGYGMPSMTPQAQAGMGMPR